MSLLAGWRAVRAEIVKSNRALGAMNRRLMTSEDLAENLSDAMPSAPVILGPDGTPAGGGGKGGLGPSFLAGSVAPAGMAGVTGSGMPNLKGTSLRIGGGGGGAAGAAKAGGESGGVKAVETNRDKIAAIVEASGVPTPAKENWNRNGTGPGEFPGFIIQTVLSLGTSAPTRFLSWCAGWLAWGGTDRASSTASRHGGGFNGVTTKGLAEARRKELGFGIWSFGPAQTQFVSEGAPGFSGGGGGGEAWAKGLGTGGGSWTGGGSDNSGGSWAGGSAFDTLTASTGKAVSEGVSKANEPVVEGINKMVDQMTKLNASLQSDGGLRYRTGGLS